MFSLCGCQLHLPPHCYLSSKLLHHKCLQLSSIAISVVMNAELSGHGCSPRETGLQVKPTGKQYLRAKNRAIMILLSRP